MQLNLQYLIPILKSKLFWIFLLVTSVVGFFVFQNYSKKTKVSVVKVTRGQIVEAVSTSGSVKADENVTLTFQSAGKVGSVKVKVGDTVKKGQVIANLDTISLNAAYMQALNNYRNYQANAQNVLDQVKDHGGDETFSQKATRTAAEVSRDNAYDSVKSAEDTLKNAILRAPFAGVITAVNPTSPGINVTYLNSGYSIVNPETVYFDAEVEEVDLIHIFPGQSVNVKFDAYPDKTFVGRVVSIGFVSFISSTGGNAYSVRISLPGNSDMKFRVGMQGDVDIIYNTLGNVVKIPSMSIFMDGEKNYVWKIVRGALQKTEIQIGGASDTETEVKSGISEGDTVVDQPPSNLKDGQAVEI